jgi:hypothetical protein
MLLANQPNCTQVRSKLLRTSHESAGFKFTLLIKVELITAHSGAGGRIHPLAAADVHHHQRKSDALQLDASNPTKKKDGQNANIEFMPSVPVYYEQTH